MPRPNEFLGLAIGHVPTSRSPYVQVPPGAIGLPRILPGAREKMSFLYAYSRLKPLPGRLSELWVGGDFAYEWNDRVDMRAWAGGVEIGHEFALNSIRRGGDKSVFERAGYAELPGWSYRSMWWHSAGEAFMAPGVHGQSLYVDPGARVVIARFASHPQAANAANDPTTLTLHQAVAEHLRKAVQ